MESDREQSHERELVLKHQPQHQYSYSDSRSLVPMWDSADPERAPPPLPLNPGSPVTRSNASATVRAAAAALQEKAEKSNENTPSSYTTNPMPLRSSPEKSLIKGPYHKRMQSLQNTTNSREYASYLERRSPEKSSRAGIFDKENQPNENNAVRAAPSTPPGRESPTHRLSGHFLTKPILGENTPPSATMLALQNMQIPIDLDTPSKDPKPKSITNANTKLSREPDSFDGLSAQIISLTGIATSLQQEMAQLSRRSKDNATDLVSLKAATNARDEDIRKSLKELTTNLSSKRFENEAQSRGGTPYLHPATGAFMIDNKAHESPPSSRKSFPLPNMPSPNSFAASLERDLTASPGTISTDGSASIALLEKVLREMATKEGQETLVKLMEEIKTRPVEKDSDSEMPKMLEEILNLVKENSDNRAHLRSRGNIGSRNLSGHAEEDEHEFDDEQPDDMTRSRGAVTRPTPHRSSSEHDKSALIQPPSILTDEVLNTLQRVKNSVAESGGLTNEVKTLVRELRGEVLGMGRELARKLQEIEASRTEEDHIPQGPDKEEISQIVEGSLAELRGHMEDMIRESQQRSSSEISQAVVGSEEIYTVVSKALSEIPSLHEPTEKDSDPGIKRDEILDAVREAWETYKPEIELQNFGLERDEILECLSEGLKDYQPQKETVEPETIYQHVLDAVHHALQDFTPPRVEPEPSASPEEIVAAVRDCLESFEWPAPPPMPEREETINRDDVLSAVREGLANQDREIKESDINREDIFEAVRVGFHDASNSMTNSMGDQVIEHLHGMVIELKDEFKQYSAANGGDTEQILDALKDGLEALRGEIESYVDRVSNVTAKDEIIDTFKDGFHSLHSDVEKCISDFAQNQPSDTVELLDAMEKEFEHLRQTMSSLLIRNNVSSDKDEILDAIRDIAEGGNLIKDKPDGSQAIKEELEHLRETLSSAIVRPGGGADTEEIIVAVRHQLEALFDDYTRRKDGSESGLSGTSELLDAFHDGIELLRSDMEALLNKQQPPADTNQNEELLHSLKEGLEGVRAEISRLHDQQTETAEASRGRELALVGESSVGGDIEGLKALVTQLQTKVDAIDVNPAPPEAGPDIARKDDVAEVLEALKEMQSSVAETRSRGIVEEEQEEKGEEVEGAKKKDLEMLEMLLQEMKTQLDELAPSANANWVTAERVEAIETLAKEMKESLTGVAAYVDTDGPSKADVTNLETVMKDIWVIVEELKNGQDSTEENAEKVVKGDVQNLEALIFDIKAQIEELVLPDVEKIPTKDDILNLTTYVTEFREKIEAENELTAQAFEARKVEHGGLAEKIEDVKTVIFGIKDELKSKLVDGEGSLVELKTMLEMLNGAADSFAKADNVKEIADLVKRESDRLAGDREASRMEGEEQAAALFSKMDENQAVIMADLSTKIDDKFNEILSKYEDSQVVAEEKFTAAEERDMHNLDTLMNTKTIAEDLKMVIAGMGDSVTEACERMSDDAKTFFGRVDESFGKVDELQSAVNTNNEDMKAQFDKALAATDRLETQIAQSHPEILSSVKDILAMVGQHYEYSRKTAEELKSDLSALPSAIPPLLPALPAPPSPSLPEEPAVEKYDDSLVHDKLDTLMEHAASTEKSVAEIEKLDYLQEQIGLIKDATTATGKSDAQMEKLQYIEEQISVIKDATTSTDRSDAQMEKLGHIEEQIKLIKDAAVSEKSDAQIEKLDRIQAQIDLMNSSVTTDKSDAQMDKLNQIQAQIAFINDARAIEKPDAQMEKLDMIQEQIKITAREVNEIMSAQSRMVMEGYEDKKQEALDTAIALERRLAQKEKVESEIVTLNREKEELSHAVQTLKQEREELSRQNFKLIKEVGGMETALRIRQEEVRLMEDRAEDLERRIVEGVLDHARSQMLSRTANPDPMNLKRVPSSASTATRKTAASNTKETNALGSGVGVALKRRTPLRPNNASNVTSNVGNARRILSLSNVTGKRGTDRQSMPLTGGGGGLTNLKRSHSVKSNYGFRKSSWEPGSLAANKENEVFPEEEEDEVEAGKISDVESDTGTERRTSYTGTFDDNMSYVSGSVVSTDRRTSYSSINAQVEGTEPGHNTGSRAGTENIQEGSENEQSILSAEEEEEEGGSDYDETETHLSLDGSEVGFYPHSDSGLGTDLNSAVSMKPSAVA